MPQWMLSYMLRWIIPNSVALCIPASTNDLVGLLHLFQPRVHFLNSILLESLTVMFLANELYYNIHVFYNTKIEIWMKLKTFRRMVIETMNLPWNPFIERGKI